MAWLTDKSDGYRMVSKEKEEVVLRDEYIPTGWNETTESADATTGETVRTTVFHQTGVVNVRCKVKQTTKVEEWRGVSEATATAEAGDTLGGETISDNRVGETWRNGLAWVSIPMCVGTITRVASHKANEANGWTVTKTTITTTKA